MSLLFAIAIFLLGSVVILVLLGILFEQRSSIYFNVSILDSEASIQDLAEQKRKGRYNITGAFASRILQAYLNEERLSERIAIMMVEEFKADFMRQGILVEAKYSYVEGPEFMVTIKVIKILIEEKTPWNKYVLLKMLLNNLLALYMTFSLPKKMMKNLKKEANINTEIVAI